jgi:glucokinase
MRIGIDIGGTNVRVGLIDKGVIVKKLVEPCKARSPKNEVLNHLKQMIVSVAVPGVESIGVGVPSVVDIEKGIVYNVANIPSWQEVHLKTILEDTFHLPAAINNDSNCFALGEYYFGEGVSCKNLVCITLGTGVGAGIMIDGKLYAGRNAGAGEIGCLPYLEHDYEYYCGSQFFLSEHGLSGKEAYRQGCKGNPLMLKLWDEMGRHIGNLLKAVLFTYDPEAIVLGGSIANAFRFFSVKMYESLQSFPYPETIGNCKIAVSSKEDIALLGASTLSNNGI